MLYTTFIRLCETATEYNDRDEFTGNLYWQEWMNTYHDDVDMIASDLSIIFDLARLDFSGLRDRLGISMARMSQLYRIPLRTLENWDSGLRIPPDYVIDFIRYSVFIREKEGDDGYIEEQD